MHLVRCMPTPDVATFGIAISALERGRAFWGRALALLAESECASLNNVSVYNATISALGSAGKWRFSTQLLQSMRDRDQDVRHVLMSLLCVTSCSMLRAVFHASKMRKEPDVTSFNATLFVSRLQAVETVVKRRHLWQDWVHDVTVYGWSSHIAVRESSGLRASRQVGAVPTDLRGCQHGEL